MGPYKNFADCVRKNQDKRNPHAYCGKIYWQIEGNQKKLDPYSESKLVQKNAPMVSDLLEMMDTTDLRIYKSKYYGQTNGKYIKTNTKKGDVLNTIIHELMHCKYPKKSEEQIKKLSAKVEGGLSMRDQARILTEYESGISRVSDRMLMYNKSVSEARNKYSKIK